MHTSPRAASNFYKSIAVEVEEACASNRLTCSAWLPALVPPIPLTQWKQLPAEFLKAVKLVFYAPPPPLPDAIASDLNAPDGVDAIEFLNRPYHFVGPVFAEAKAKSLLRSTARFVLAKSFAIYQAATILGLAALIIAFLISWRATITSDVFLIVVALIVAAIMRGFLLASIEISSFPVVYPTRMVPAMPLAIVCALLSIQLLVSSIRNKYFGTA